MKMLDVEGKRLNKKWKKISFFLTAHTFLNFKAWRYLVHALYLYSEDVVKKARI